MSGTLRFVLRARMSGRQRERKGGSVGREVLRAGEGIWTDAEAIFIVWGQLLCGGWSAREERRVASRSGMVRMGSGE